MENKQPTFLDLLLEAHIGLERQGPGSVEATKQALHFLGDLSRFRQIADLGCGTGGQTLLLAEHLPGEIVGLDLFPAFVEKLNEKAASKGLGGRVKGIAGKMEDLPFEKASLDLIWSEGAIDNIGFEKGLRYWRGFLRDGGYVAVTAPTWLTKERLAAVERFWTDAGSQLNAADDAVAALQRCGYRFIAAFALDETCWTDNYFAPREQAIEKLIKKYGGCDTVREYAASNRREAELYHANKQHYGYVFYIGRAN